RPSGWRPQPSATTAAPRATGRGSTAYAIARDTRPTTAASGPARAKPPSTSICPVTIGPTTWPRLWALLLSASIVPRASSERPATMVWLAGTPTHVVIDKHRILTMV